jgi:hypothetical protein
MSGAKDSISKADFDAGIKILEENLRGGPVPSTKRTMFRQELKGVSVGIWKRAIALCVRKYSWIPTPEELSERIAEALEESAYRSQVESQEQKRRDAEFAAAPRVPVPASVREKYPNLFKGKLLKTMDDAGEEPKPVVDIGMAEWEIEAKCEEAKRHLRKQAEDDLRDRGIPIPEALRDVKI